MGCSSALTGGRLTWFVELNNTGGEVDVWAVEGIAEDQLLDAGSGFLYFPGTISADAVERIQLSRHITEARCAHSGCADPCASRRALARSIHKSCHGR